MQARLDPWNVAPDLMQGMLAMEKVAANSGIEHSLYELIKTRASQINGCAYCLHMHTSDARKAGESEMRLYLLNAWRESSLYSERERAALAWTESLTLISEKYASDEDYQNLCQHFTEKERVAVTLAITTINAWNRIAIGFRSQHPEP